MASRKTYECFVCKRQGFDNVQVYLDGKDSEGRTKYLNEDMTIHTHQGGSSSSSSQATQPQSQPQQQPQQQGSTTVVTAATNESRILNVVNVINAKLESNRIASKPAEGRISPWLVKRRIE